MTIFKDIGRDCELSTTGHDERGTALSSWSVARAVMGSIDAAFEPDGAATWRRATQWGNASATGGYAGSAWSMDCLRSWAPNGQCFYVDMSHIEACTAAARAPRELAAQSLAALRVVEAARKRAEEEAPAGTRYQLSATNADLSDPAVSWGTHLNVSVSPALWENLLLDHRQPGVHGYVLSLMAAAIPFFGAGYLLPMRDGTVIYTPSARAHQITHSQTLSTTEAFGRGLLNSRREAHGDGVDRLHLIGFDFNLISAALLGCFLQCGLGAAEEGYGGLILHSPLRALHTWSFQQDLPHGRFDAAAIALDGREFSLPAFVRELAQTFLQMCEGGLLTDEVAPEATELLPLIVDLTHHAERGELQRCARHLDWAAKLMILRQMSQTSSGDLGSAAARLADHDFASTDPERGALWRLWEADLVDPLVGRDEVAAALCEGPPGNRGWVRGRLIREFHSAITDVDWSHVELRRGEDRWGRRLRIEMPRTDRPDRASCAAAIAAAEDVEELEQLMESADGDALGELDPLLEIGTQLATEHQAVRHGGTRQSH